MNEITITFEGEVVRYGTEPGHPTKQATIDFTALPGSHSVPRKLIAQCTRNLFGRRVRLSYKLEILE